MTKLRAHILGIITLLILLTSVGNVSSQNKPGGQANSQATSKITAEFGEYGTLLKARTSTGKELFKMANAFMEEGYAITYEVKDAKTGKAGEERSIYALGNKASRE